MLIKVINGQRVAQVETASQIHIPNSNGREDLMSPEMLADYGWFTPNFADLPAGAVVTAEHWTIDGTVAMQIVDAFRTAEEVEAERIAAEQAAALAEVERKNTAINYDQPIEVPYVVIQSQSLAKGIGIVATDEGDLVTFTYHASPVPEAAEIKRRIAQAVTEHKAAKQAAKDELDALKAEVKALKEKVK